MHNRQDRDPAATEVGASRETRVVVAGSALAAIALRLPGVPQPIYPDEAGFILVARAWEPSADSVYGHYFVDRPPPLIALYGLADLLGSPVAIRLLGALAAAATVLLVARIALLAADQRAARASALGVAALVATPLIDSVSVNGELLALPLISLAAYAALLAVRGGTRRPAVYAAAAGCAGALALGLKQNLVGGLVFAGILMVTSWLTGDLAWRRLRALLGALAIGAAVPVVATAAWAVAAGVQLDALWYALYGFRADASDVLTFCCEGAAYERLWLLVLAAVQGGVAVALVAFAAHLRWQWRADRPTTAAVTAMLLVDLVGLAASGSYWPDYLFPLIPGVGIAVALLVGRSRRRWSVGHWVAGFAAGSTVVATVGWAGAALAGVLPEPYTGTGRAIGEVARPGDTLVVHGGRANIQFASGLDSPYRHLWSLPMRTLDPEYDELRRLLSGPRAPTWLVELVHFETWGGDRLADLVERRYVEHSTNCDVHAVYLLRGVSRPPLGPEC